MSRGLRLFYKRLLGRVIGSCWGIITERIYFSILYFVTTLNDGGDNIKVDFNIVNPNTEYNYTITSLRME